MFHFIRLNYESMKHLSVLERRLSAFVDGGKEPLS
jgi:hypothetical protein